MRARPSPRLPIYVLVGLIAAALAFVTAVQVRSQAAVERSLSGQDPTSLAFLIDDLHTANDSLTGEVARLETQRDALRGAGAGPGTALKSEIGQLELVEGLVPAHGPGVVISIDARLQALDLEDALNNLRISGAEAITVDGRRVVTSSALADLGGQVAIDGRPVSAPWTIVAIGNPDQLASAADAMTRSLKSDPRVSYAGWRSEADLRISAVLAERPLVYGSPG